MSGKMIFGEHKGRYFEDVPSSYLVWVMMDNVEKIPEDLQEYLEENQEYIIADAKSGRPE